jgi:hypothetical protein
MLNINSLKKLIQMNSDGDFITSDQMMQKLSDGSYNVVDVANFLNTVSMGILEKAIEKAEYFIKTKRVDEQRLIPREVKDITTDIVTIGMLVFYLVMSTTPKLARRHGIDPERSTRALLSAYSLYTGRRRGVKAQINPAFSGPIEDIVDKPNIAGQYVKNKLGENMSSLNKLRVLIIEQRAEMAMNSQPPPDITGEPDYEGDMARNELKTAARDAMALVQRLQESDQLPAWCQSKITLASEYIQTVKEYLESEVSDEESEEI